MEQIIHNAILYIIELVKLMLFSFGISRLKIRNTKRAFLLAIFSIFCVLIMSAFFDLYKIGILYGAIAVTACLLMLENTKKVSYLFIEYLTICIFDMVTSNIFMFLFKMSVDHSEKHQWLDYVMNSLSIPVLILIYLITERNSKQNIDLHFSGKYIAVLLIGSVLFTLYINSLSLFSFTSSAPTLDKMLTIVISISSLAFVIVAFSLIYQKSRTEQMKKEAELTTELLKSQERYYSMLLQKEDETKRFRHDINDHFYAIKMLAEDNRYDELNKYLDNMEIGISKLNTGINSGIRIIDAIANECLAGFADVRLTWEGHLPEEINVAKMDLCTVFSNLLKNAFEATSKCVDKWVNVKVNVADSGLYIKISNSTIQVLRKEGDKIKSSKSGADHGYGLQNVNAVIAKYNGELKISCFEGIVEVEVVLLN